MIRNEEFLREAEALRPRLHVNKTFLRGDGRILKAGDEALFDFGDHLTGYVTVEFESTGRHQDAPLHFRADFLESREEFGLDPRRYHGWISSSWIQREQVHLDVLPCSFRFDRRYAFRYVRIRILAVSSNFSVRIKSIRAEAVSSADDTRLLPFKGREEDRRLDRVSVRTLHECMQEVFEDGPKRDRRLWLGDLRLQALANYETYRNYDLVRRCLYLFAGDTFEDGRVANNVFIHPEPAMDDQFMFDYSLFFINTLWDYYEATGDIKTLKDLEPTALRQYELAADSFDARGIADLRKTGPVFVDWKMLLDKQASAQGIYLYALRALVRIERELGKDVSGIEREIGEKTAAARKHLFRRGLFVSGPLSQVSVASQVWMVLGGVTEGEEAREILARVERRPLALKPGTPYMFHHYVAALLSCGEKEKAYGKMKAYWGAMLERGADTFYEAFDPARPGASPYGGRIVHSYCHAWSCTPAYFLRKYYSEE